MGLIRKTHVKHYAECLQKLTIHLLESEYFADCSELQVHLLDLILNTVPNNEFLHGLTNTLSLLHLNHAPSDIQLEETYVIGWCLQMFATCYLIQDDLFDESKTRHYKPCWYLRKERGNKALLDALLLENCVFYLLQSFFGEKPYYSKMLFLFNEAKHKIAYASVYEEILSLPSNRSSMFTIENYTLCVSYKMAYYPIYIHVLIAMLQNGVVNPEEDFELSEIFSKIDFHFQVRDDYLDAYGDNSDNESETGTDIEKGRCTWNICTAMAICTENQKQSILKNYGCGNNDVARQTVKFLFDDIDLRKSFAHYELVASREVLSSIAVYNRQKRKCCVPSILFQDMMWASFPNLKLSNSNSFEVKARGKTIRKSSEDLTKLKTWVSDFFDFLGEYPDFICKTLNFLNIHVGDTNNVSHITRLLYYNLLPGKNTRGMLVLKTIKMHYSGNDKQVLLKKAKMVGWCIEMLQAAALIADDVMDNGTLRRGQPCWHKFAEVGLHALTDGVFLISLVWKILKDVAGNEPYFAQLESIFQTVILQTVYGQQQDTLLSTGTDKMLVFTMQNYEQLVRYKTSYYTFLLPALCAMTMMGENDTNVVQSVTNILLRVGYYFQVHDDYLDAFCGDSSQKTNNDIAEGKCTWFICRALEMSNNEERVLLMENYGKLDKTCVEKVLSQYMLLGLKDEFETLRRKELQNTTSLIEMNEHIQKNLKEFLQLVSNEVFKIHVWDEDNGNTLVIKKTKMNILSDMRNI